VREEEKLLGVVEIGDAGKRRSGSLGADSLIKANFPSFREAISRRRRSKRRRQSDKCFSRYPAAIIHDEGQGRLQPLLNCRRVFSDEEED